VSGAAVDGFIEINIAVTNLDVESALGVRAHPGFVVDGSTLAAEV
jgi:hypothetical protein